MSRTSFTRKGGAAAASDLGTKPGLHGQTLVSSGHAELDKLLGGGLPLGSLLLILEDASSRHHASLLRYFLGEGIACGQRVALGAASEPAGGLAQFIPQQLKRSSAPGRQQAQLEEEKDDEGQYTLRIAWQYRRYLKLAPQRSPHAVTSAAAVAAAAAPMAGAQSGLAEQRSAPPGSPASTKSGSRMTGPETPAVPTAGADAVAGSGRRVRIAAPELGSGGAGVVVARGLKKEWCHQFDLGRGLGRETLEHGRATFLGCSGVHPLLELLTGAAAFLQSLDQPVGSAIVAAAAPAAPPQQEGAVATGPASEARQCSGNSSRGMLNPGQPPGKDKGATLPRGSQPLASVQPLPAEGNPPAREATHATDSPTEAAVVVRPRMVPPAGVAAAASLASKAPSQVGRLAVLSLGAPAWWTRELPSPEESDGPTFGSTPSRQDGSFHGRPQAFAGIYWGHGGGTTTVPHGGSDPGGDVSLQQSTLQSLLQLKALVRERRCAAVVTVPAALHSAHSIARMAHLADAVLALEGVADDSDIVRLAPDSASVAGLLHVRKLFSLGALAPPSPEVALFLIRNKRRRLAITPVEIDPDAEAGLGDGASGSVVSLLCGQPSAAGSPLDF
ncbi:hypothetical protein N2152v2_009319 [Parachlorella kessleri]